MIDISEALAMRVRPSALFLLLLALSCTRSRPDTPAIPVGPDSVDLGCPGLFKTWVSSGAGHGPPVSRFDWGDGDTSVWCGPGETAILALLEHERSLRRAGAGARPAGRVRGVV